MHSVVRSDFLNGLLFLDRLQRDSCFHLRAEAPPLPRFHFCSLSEAAILYLIDWSEFWGAPHGMFADGLKSTSHWLHLGKAQSWCCRSGCNLHPLCKCCLASWSNQLNDDIPLAVRANHLDCICLMVAYRPCVKSLTVMPLTTRTAVAEHYAPTGAVVAAVDLIHDAVTQDLTDDGFIH